VPAKPWDQGVGSRTERDVALLSEGVRGHLKLLLDEEDRQNKGDENIRQRG
jgi:hypothetical protein